MQTLVLNDIRRHFGLAQPDKNGLSTFELSHLLFVLVNDSNICKDLCARDLPIKTWRVKVKTSIQAVLKHHIGDSFSGLTEAGANHLILLLLRIVNINESLRNAFKLDATLPNLENWLSQFQRMPTATAKFEAELNKLFDNVIIVNQEDMLDIMMVAGAYAARYLPETYRHLVPEVVTRFRSLAKLFGLNLDVGPAAQLLSTIENFQAGDMKFRESLHPLVATIEKNRRFSQFLYGEQPLPKLKEEQSEPVKSPRSADTKRQIKQIGVEIKKQAPAILLQLLRDPSIKILKVDHDRLAEFALTYVEKVSQKTEDIDLFLEQVCKRFPELQKEIEGALFLFELAGNTASNSLICEKRRLAVCTKLRSLFAETLHDNPNVATIFETLELYKTTCELKQNNLDDITNIVSTQHYGDKNYRAEVHAKIVHRVTLAFYYGPEVNLRMLARYNNHNLLRHLAAGAPPESVSKLLRRIRILIPPNLFNQCVLEQSELLNDKYHLFTNRSANIVTKIARRFSVGRMVLGDAPGDDFAYENLISKYSKDRSDFIKILLNNPIACDGFFNSSAIAKSDATYFALFYAQALQMSQNQMNDDDKLHAFNFVNKLLQGPDQQINLTALQKLWTGLRNVEQGAMRDLSGVVLAVEKNFDPIDPISILGHYLRNQKTIVCQNQDRTNKNIKMNYTIHLPDDPNSFDEIFVRAIKSRVNAAIVHAVSFGEMQRFITKPEDSPLYTKLQKLAAGLFVNQEKHPRFAEMLGFLLSSEAFKKITLYSPVIHGLCDKLKAGDIDSWLVVTQYANHINLKIDNSIPGKKIIYFKCGGSQAVEFEIIDPSPELGSLLKEYDIQLHQTDYSIKQQEFAKRINRLCDRLEQVTPDEMLEVLSTTHAKASTLLTLMTSEKFGSVIHHMNIVQPGLTHLVYDIVSRIQQSKMVSDHAKLIAGSVKNLLDRACEPLEVTEEIAGKMTKENWRQPQAKYYVSPSPKNTASVAAVSNLHPTELDLSKSTLVVG